MKHETQSNGFRPYSHIDLLSPKPVHVIKGQSQTEHHGTSTPVDSLQQSKHALEGLNSELRKDANLFAAISLLRVSFGQ